MIFITPKCLRFLAIATILSMAGGHAQARDYIPNIVKVSLLRQKDKSGEAYLHLTTPVAVTGCPRVQPLRNTIETDANTLYVNIEGYSIDFNNMSHNPQFACKTGMQFSTADIPLDRSLIEGNKIEKIRFNLGKGLGKDTYKIVMTKNSLELVVETSTIFKPGMMPSGGQTALIHWYYPKNTLILSAPMAAPDEQSQTVDAYARSHGLTPLNQDSPGFPQPSAPAGSGQTGRYYYVDHSGKTIAKISGPDDINLSDAIYARRPGTYE